MLDKKQDARVLRYMQQTNQSKILLVVGEDLVLIERKDGATNNEQESGYHDYLVVTALPPPITIVGVK